MSDTLFDLDALQARLPIDEPAVQPPKPAPRYYLWKERDGEKYVLWRVQKFNTWWQLNALGRKKPHFYKTLSTANRAAIEHDAQVGVWENTP